MKLEIELAACVLQIYFLFCSPVCRTQYLSCAVQEYVDDVFIKLLSIFFTLIKVFEWILTYLAKFKEKESPPIAELDMDLSGAENVGRLLKYIVCADVPQDVKSRAGYCIDILKSNVEDLNIPLGLLKQPESYVSNLPSQVEDTVQDWLLSQFSRTSICSTTATPEMTERRKSNVSLSSEIAGTDGCEKNHPPSEPSNSQQTAIPNTYGAGVLFQCSNIIAEADPAEADLSLPFATEPAERQAIMDALRGIDRWDWDVFALHRATQGRELEVLPPLRRVVRAEQMSPTTMEIRRSYGMQS